MAKERKSGMSGNPRIKGKMDPTIQHQIGDQLRSMYDDVLREPVPDRFLALLKRLEEQQDREKDE